MSSRPLDRHLSLPPPSGGPLDHSAYLSFKIQPPKDRDPGTMRSNPAFIRRSTTTTTPTAPLRISIRGTKRPLDSPLSAATPPPTSEPTDSTDSSTEVQYKTHLLKCLIDDCLMLVKTEHSLNNHLISAHGILPFRCYLDHCGLSFPSAHTLRRHHDAIHRHLGSALPCAYCNQTLSSPTQLTSHVAQVHQLGLFSCTRQRCHFRSLTRAEIITHYTTEHKRYRCYFDGCTKSYNDASNRRRHEKTHYTDGRNYRCRFFGCHFGSINVGSVLRHIEKNHFPEGGGGEKEESGQDAALTRTKKKKKKLDAMEFVSIC